MNRGLWREHGATPRQKRLLFRQTNRKKARSNGEKPTQGDVLLAMLREARRGCVGLQLPAIMAAGIAQHGARFNELRSRGFVIHNEIERAKDGRVRSRYYLHHDPECDGERK